MKWHFQEIKKSRCQLSASSVKAIDKTVLSVEKLREYMCPSGGIFQKTGFIQSRVAWRNSGKRIDGEYFMYLTIKLRLRLKSLSDR